MILKLLGKVYKFLFKRKPKFSVGEIVFTEDNGYVKIDSIISVGYWYDKRTIIYVTIVHKNSYTKRDVYYNYKAFIKLPEDSLIRVLFE